MDYSVLAAQYRRTAEHLREREQQLAAQPPEMTREDRRRTRERILLLRTEYCHLTQTARHLERYEQGRRRRRCK